MSTDDSNRDRGRGEISPEDREALRRRAAEIGRRLDSVNAQRHPESSGRDAASSGSGRRGMVPAAASSGARFTFELLAGVGAGLLLGWWLDGQLGTSPWLMIICLMVGFAGPLVNAMRAAGRDKSAQEASRSPARSVRDDDEDR